ncbi:MULTISPECIES: MbtH family protein [unclassified Kitasatospora]
MTSPFDAEDGRFTVLVNARGQFSLWPAAAGVPAGWTAEHGPVDRTAALAYVNEHWTDLRPKSLTGRPLGQPDD